MWRLINIAMLAVVIAAATWTYSIKHKADEQLAEIRSLERKIALERETIELLKADWAHLSNPARLQELIEKYAEELGLDATAADQIISLSELPPPPVFDLGDAVGDIIAGEIDDAMTTGSVSGGGAQ